MAIYQYKTLAEEKVTWEAGNGQEIEMVVKLEKELRDETGTGNHYLPKSLDIKWTGKADGKKQNAFYIKKVDHPAIVAAFGKIGIVENNYERLMTAKAKVKNHPEWQEKLQQEIARNEAEKEYEQHALKMQEIMR